MGRWSIPPEVHDHGRFLLRRRDFAPAYLQAYENGLLRDKVDAALAHLGPSCSACPRLCKGVDRLANQFGVCKVGRHARVASAFPHFGEEDGPSFVLARKLAQPVAGRRRASLHRFVVEIALHIVLNE